jgi:peptide/nickel transport system permease protein
MDIMWLTSMTEDCYTCSREKQTTIFPGKPFFLCFWPVLDQGEQMLKYTLKRILNILPVLLGLSLMIFTIIDAMPGDALMVYLDDEIENLTAVQVAQMRAKLGLDQPVHIRYLKWLGRSVSGDFGRSIIYRRPATEVIGTGIWNTFYLNAASFLLIVILAIPLGIRSAVKKYSLFDKAVSAVTILSISIPSFFIALFLIYFIAVPIPWMPGSGMRSVLLLARGYPSAAAEIMDVVKHMILPVTALTLTGFGSITRYIRNAVIDVINRDYIRTARAKGLAERVVFYRHAFRNALIPVISIIGLAIPTLFVGNIIIEAVFAWPGIGLIFLQGIVNRDIPIIMAATLFYALISVLGNLFADICYGLADPRIRVR